MPKKAKPASSVQLTYVSPALNMPTNVAQEAVRYAADGRIFYFHDGRNAWWTTWSQHYPGQHAFCSTLKEAQDRIEGKRVQGSMWTIAVLPTLVFVGTTHMIVVGEINTGYPLSEYAPPLATQLGRISDHFQPRREDSVFRFLCKAEKVILENVSMHRYKSVPKGGAYRLEWRGAGSADSDMKHIDHIRRTYNASRKQPA